jgi:hypothetical protein
MNGGVLANKPEVHPPGIAHVIGLVLGWVVLTAVIELVLVTFWFASTIAVFSFAGPLPTLVGIGFAVLALAGAPLGCAYIVRRGDRWLMSDK